MKRSRKKSLCTQAPALSPAKRAEAEITRLAKLKPLLMKSMLADEKRRRARRAQLLAILKGKRTAAEERQLSSMAVDYIMQATGVFGCDQKHLAEADDGCI